MLKTRSILTVTNYGTAFILITRRTPKKECVPRLFAAARRCKGTESTRARRDKINLSLRPIPTLVHNA